VAEEELQESRIKRYEKQAALLTVLSLEGKLSQWDNTCLCTNNKIINLFNKYNSLL